MLLIFQLTQITITETSARVHKLKHAQLSVKFSKFLTYLISQTLSTILIIVIIS